MKYSFSPKLSFLIALVFSVPHMAAVVVWDATFTSDVTDDLLIIDGSLGEIVLPVGYRTINAVSGNVPVILQNNPIIRGNPAGESQLILNTTTSTQIGISLKSFQSLTFKGSINSNLDPLLIYQKGNVQWNFGLFGGGPTSLAFTSDVNSGGTWFYVESSATNNRSSFNSFNNTSIFVGPRSIIGFTNIAGTNGNTGVIEVSPEREPSSVDQTKLIIDPAGAVLVYPVVVSPYDSPFPPLTTANILKNSISEGASVSFSVAYTPIAGIVAGFQVINNNTQLFDLLIDPFCNLGSKDDPNYVGAFSGIQYGFVLGGNGILNVSDNTYFDYVGTASNICPVALTTFCQGAISSCATGGCDVTCTGTLVKERNPSALFVDGSYNPNIATAQMLLGQNSAVFFRSGGDKFGTVQNPAQPHQFTINPVDQTGGAGSIVFDVEGFLRVKGSNIGDTLFSKIELLSREVYQYGGPLFYNTDQTIFPIRTFAVDGDGAAYQYNKGCFLINNRMNLCGTTLVHTDLNHVVLSKNDVASQPTYVGGERPLLCGGERPKIVFYGSQLFMHESGAFTGVDLFVPNRIASSPQYQAVVGLPNTSKFIFFSNGRAIDNGTGRQMILGTLPGSTACDGCTIVSNDAHLDVFQDVDFNIALGGIACDASSEPVCTIEDQTQSVANCSTITPVGGLVGSLAQELLLDVSANTTVINDQVPPFPANISNQYPVHTIYLGNASNISVGTNTDTTPFENTTTPTLTIDGNFYSFETRGGPLGIPSSSQVTGKGGIFVDLNGTFNINPAYRANMATMVTRSRNGVVALPKNQVLFHDRIGLGNWKLDLNTDSEVIVAPGEYFSDYSLNWIDTVKDFSLWTPYVIDSVNSCVCPPVVSENITPVPTVLGRIDQMQIIGSRLGDEAFIKIGQGGFVRELIYLNGCISGEETVGFVILEDDSRVGIGSAHRNIDSLSGSLRLGVNGVSIIGNGSADVVLNEDVEIDDVCPILMGPDFLVTDTLRFTSEDPRVLTVKKNGALDLRSFTSNTTVEFGGQITIVLEPGARILGNGGIIRLADKARMVVQTVERAEDIFTTNTSSGVNITDDFRVKLIGTGVLEVAECSAVFIETDGFMGVETLYEYTGTQTCEISNTDFTLRLVGSGQFIIGTDCEQEGGTFQIGNTVDIPGHTVNFNIELASANAQFQVKTGGFLGFGVGIATKASDIPNEWRIDNLFNVNAITVNIIDGVFTHDHIYPGSSSNASLFAIGLDTVNAPLYTFNYEQADTEQRVRTNNAGTHGGGNLVVLSQDATGPVNPIVGDIDNQTLANGRMVVGTFASIPLMPASPVAFNVNGTDLFNAIKTYNMQSNVDTRARNRANVAQGIQEFGKALEPARGLFVFGPTNSNAGTIERMDVYDIQPSVLGLLPSAVIAEAIDVGAAIVKVQNPADPQNSAFYQLIPE